MKDSLLFRILKNHLSPESVVRLREALVARPPEAYDRVLQEALKAAPRLEREVDRNRRKTELLCGEGVPIGRLRLLIENSSPPMLVALARQMMRESYDQRFDNPKRSLQLAELGLEAAIQLHGDTDYLAAAPQADLEARAWIWLANARRINSDLHGAEEAFVKAERLLPLGTRDRKLKADLLHKRATLRFSQGQIDEAAGLYDQEIGLRRVIGEPSALGVALIDRGVVAAWRESTVVACNLLTEGAELVDSEDSLLLALGAVAERLARDGEGLSALKVVYRAETMAALAESESHQLRLRWVKGIAFRALGEAEDAEKELRAVREQLAEVGPKFRAAIASLDLAAACAAQGKVSEVQEIAREAYAIFQAEGLDRRALAALLVFQEAAAAAELTEVLAVRVANFIVGYQYNRSLRFEPVCES